MNWNHLKKYSKDELLSLVPEGFEFKTPPWTHQIAAFIATIANDGFLCALDLGTGKTKVSIDYCKYLEQELGSMRALVLCLHSAVENIRDEVNIHSDMSAVCLRGSKKDKFQLIKEDANFFIINYEGLRAMLTMKVESSREPITDKNGDMELDEDGEIVYKIKNKQVVNQKDFNIFMSTGRFNTLVIDESHLLKNIHSLNFIITKKISAKTQNKVLLTGTPFGNTLLDIWAQYFVMDFGKTFDTSFTRFKNAYFKDKGYFGPKWVVTENGEKIIKEKMFTRAIRYKEDEVDDLPEKVFRTLKYSLTPEQRKAYSAAKESMEENVGSSRYHEYRRISSGFQKDEKKFKKNPKLDLLWDLIEGVVEDHKIVIFTEYIVSHEIITKLLKKKKIKFCHLSGKTKKNHEQITTFQTDSSYRVMVANMKSGSASINLFAATYCIHYELGGSVIEYKQSLKRIHRGGQLYRCFLYVLLGTGKVEVGMSNNLKNGVDAFSRIVDEDDFIDGK